MRNGLIGLLSTMLLVSTLATAGCKSNASDGGAGGTGGSSSNGGNTGAGGNSGNGGTTGAGGACACTGGAGGTGGSSSSGGAGGGGASGGSSVTTISGTKALGALTTAEATQLCDDTDAYFGKNVTQATTCKWTGLYYATQSSAPTQDMLRKGCTDHESACLKADASTVSTSSGCSDIPSTCTATVAQYAVCISDQVANFNQTVNGLPSCDSFTTSATSGVWDALSANLPASCTSITDKCPELSPPTLFN